MAKDVLAGLTTAQKKKIRAQIKEEKELARKVADKDDELLYDNLISLQNEMILLIEKYKREKKVPQSTNLKKILLISAKKPRLIGNWMRKNFGRKTTPVKKAKTIRAPAIRTPSVKKKAVKKPVAKK